MESRPYRGTKEEEAAEYSESQRTGRSHQLWPVYEVNTVSHGMIEASGDGRFYFPMGTPSLPFELAKVSVDLRREEPVDDISQLGRVWYPVRATKGDVSPKGGPRVSGDEEAVLRFVKRWGLLRLPEIEDMFVLEALQFFLMHVYTVKMILDLYDSLGREEHRLKRILSDVTYSQSGQYENEQTIHWLYAKGEHLVEGTSSPKFVSDLDVAKYIVATSVSANLGVTPQIGLNTIHGVRTLELGNRFEALVDVVYWHLAHIVTQQKPLHQCEFCGGYFLETRKGQRYCPPPEAHRKEVAAGLRNRAQSLCAVRHRTNKHRSKTIAGGRTHE